MGTSRAPDSSSSTSASARPVPEPLDLDALPLAAGEVAEALERNRPGPMTLDQYARFVKSFRFTAEQLRAIPLDEGAERFTLD
ncbi:MAG: hypothetical protein EDX89_01630 [Acidobacteria bacterium]|nr:MAG: hypothetical protein EDX89_01630 [Acidobacteriota bacterium]MCE7957808.1 hypothetical protein [Acidobacteria bacterium ACB2]